MGGITSQNPTNDSRNDEKSWIQALIRIGEEKKTQGRKNVTKYTFLSWNASPALELLNAPFPKKFNPMD